MEIEKIRNTTDAELRHQEHELSDQLFRLKFQMKMGQTESLKKVRGLRKDIARLKTIARERVLGSANGAGGNGHEPAAAKTAKKPVAHKTEAKAASKTEKKAEKKTAT